MNAAVRGLRLANLSEESKDNVAPLKWRAAVKLRGMIAVLSLAAIVAVGAAAAVAGSCRVLLVLGSVGIEPSPAGMSLRISGSWEFDNLVQVSSGLSYNVLVVRNNQFVRFRYPGQTFSGSVAGLGKAVDDGLVGSDLVAIEAAGVSQPGARFVSVEAHRMKLTSPVPSGTGPITTIAYLVLDGDYVSPVVSNAITRPLELSDPTVDPEGNETGEGDDQSDGAEGLAP